MGMGADAVVEIGVEHSVADHVGLLARHALVVHVDRAAEEGQGAVVHYVDVGVADELAHAVGEYRCALAVEVGLE